MKTVKVLTVASVCLVAISTPRAAEPAWEWVQLAGGINEDAGTGVAVDPLGNVFFSGFVYAGKIGTTSVVNRSQFWLKLDKFGTISQIRTAASGGTAAENASALTIAPGG